VLNFFSFHQLRFSPHTRSHTHSFDEDGGSYGVETGAFVLPFLDVRAASFGADWRECFTFDCSTDYDDGCW